MKNFNIVLIGMPSAGKSTIGNYLSQNLKMQFIDTDNLIYNNQKKPLKDIVIEDGLDYFLKVQEKIILELNIQNHIISTGGSVIYSEKSINHFKKNSKIIYLKLSLNNLEKRIIEGRRFAKTKNQNLYDIYNERIPLYEKYADIIIDCTNKEIKIISSEIINLLNN